MLSLWGEIDPRRVTGENWWGDSLALVQNVPALVCRNCGEAYFEADVCRKLDKLRAAPPAALKIPAAASRRKSSSRRRSVTGEPEFGRDAQRIFSSPLRPEELVV